MRNLRDFSQTFFRVWAAGHIPRLRTVTRLDILKRRTQRAPLFAQQAEPSPHDT